MNQLTVIFKALSEPIRLRIVHRLLGNGAEAYGGQLAAALGIPAYRLSRHLKVLRTAGLIHERRVGRWIYYSLAKGNGQVPGGLRRLLARASTPLQDGSRGRGRSRGRPRIRLRRQGRREGFNWDAGPAIPGLL